MFLQGSDISQRVEEGKREEKNRVIANKEEKGSRGAAG